MPCDSNRLPGGRENQLAIAKNWLTVLGTQADAWNIPAAEVTEFQTLTTSVTAALDAAQSRVELSKPDCTAPT
jgi:hypothetical protein